MLPDVKDLDIGLSYQLDHSIVYLILKKEERKRNKQLWKFNNSLLKVKIFVEAIKEVITDLKKEYAVLVYDFSNISNILHGRFQLTISDQ